MMPDVDKVLEQALRFPPEARAGIAGSLIESLDEHLDPDAEQAWVTEIERRIRELDSGQAKGIPWSEARRRIVGL
jgi:putative addiction module component (TIGR02574 family)